MFSSIATATAIPTCMYLHRLAMRYVCYFFTSNHNIKSYFYSAMFIHLIAIFFVDYTDRKHCSIYENLPHWLQYAHARVQQRLFVLYIHHHWHDTVNGKLRNKPESYNVSSALHQLGQQAAFYLHFTTNKHLWDMLLVICEYISNLFHLISFQIQFNQNVIKYNFTFLLVRILLAVESRAERNCGSISVNWIWK